MDAMADEYDTPPCEDAPEDARDCGCNGHQEDVPDHYLDAAARIATDLTDAHDAVAAEIANVLHGIDSELRAAETEANIAVAQTIGTIDSELRRAGSVQWDQMVKAVDAIARDLILAEEQLRAVGVAVPQTTQQRIADLEDETSQRLMARLMSVDPDASEATPVGLAVGGADGEGAATAPRPDAVATPAECACPPSAAPLATPLATPIATPLATVAPNVLPASGLAPPANTAPEPSAARPLELFDINAALALGAPSTMTAAAPPIPTAPSPLPGAETAPASPPLPASSAPDGVTRLVSVAPVAGLPPIGMNWGSTLVCDAIARQLQVVATVAPKASGADTVAGAISAITGFTPGQDFASGIVAALRGGSDKSGAQAGALQADVLAAAGAAISLGADIVKGMTGDAVPDPEAAIALAPIRAMVNRLDTIAGTDLTYITASLDYLYRAANPQYIPEQSTLDAAFLSDVVDLERWSCLTRAHGNKPELARWGWETQQVGFSVPQLIDLERRGIINTESLYQRARGAGLLQPSRLEEFRALMQFIPTPPDIARYMVRDVFDDDVVKAQGLDTDFEKKFYGAGGKVNPGPAATWMRAAGIDETVARYDWRAHWQPPSNTLAFDSLHRLRADRKEYRDWVHAFTEAEDRDAYIKAHPEPLVVSEEDVAELLAVNDMFPAWIRRAIAVSYNTLTNSDCTQAYMQGAMAEDELESRYRDNGLSEEAAKRKVSIQRALKAKRFANTTGLWTERSIAAHYREGAITQFQADNLLRALMPDDKSRADFFSAVDLSVRTEARSERIKRYKRTFVIGASSAQQTIDALVSDGIETNRANDMVASWDEQRKGRLREPTAMRIITWVKNGLIEAADAAARLMALGYSDVDSVRIVAEGLIAAKKDREKKVKEIMQDQERQFKDAKQAKRADDKELKDRQKELDKKLADAKKERDRIQKELDARMPKPPEG